MRYPGQKESFPIYMQNVPHLHIPGAGHGGQPDNPDGLHEDPPFVDPVTSDAPPAGKEAQPGHHQSILRPAGPMRPRGESLAQMSRRVDFSLGMKDISAADMPGDVYDDRSTSRSRVEEIQRLRMSPNRSSERRSAELGSNASRRSQDDIGRSSSVFREYGPRHPGLTRIGTDSSASRNRRDHRNRFFGRDRGVVEDDLMESGMADIPEESFRGGRRLDPRSGMVSPRAWRPTSGESEDLGGPASGGAVALGSGVAVPKRAATEDFGVKRK